MKVIDNLLDKNDFIKLIDKLDGPEFPWYFLKGKVHADDGHYQMCHNFFLEGKPQSQYLTILDPFITKLNIGKVIRIKANITFKKNTNEETDMHTDLKRVGNEKFKTAVFYCNTNNGSTLFKSGEKILSKENRVVIFDGDKLHCGVSCTDKDRRIVINFNYIEKSS